MDAVYARIPVMKACIGACAEACGPIGMFTGEWSRIKRRVGHTPRVKHALTCPMLSASGSCTVYNVRPFICRLWGTIKEMQCPAGCEPERWLSMAEAREIFEEVRAIAGPGNDGPLGNVESLWDAIDLERRHIRRRVIEYGAQKALKEFHDERQEATESDPDGGPEHGTGGTTGAVDARPGHRLPTTGARGSASSAQADGGERDAASEVASSAVRARDERAQDRGGFAA